MTTTNEAFAALMPEPAFRLAWHGNSATYRVSKPNIGGDHDCYTADQMRQMFDAATERAAKLCDEMAEGDAFERNKEAEKASSACAAAIRAGGEKT